VAWIVCDSLCNMSGSPKQKLHPETGEETTDEKELYLRDGRKLVVSDDLVEIRSESGLVEIRIQLTEQGPVLQVEAARLSLKASEQVEIAGKKVSIKSEEDIEVEADGIVRIAGKMIYLN